jgi:hypothetical protein
MMGPIFSFLGVWKGEFFKFGWVFSLILNMFPAGSLEVPQVPKLFPKAFPIAPQFYLKWFAQSSSLMYIN